jgi:hypothetical protein
LMQIAHQTTCRLAEARSKPCALLYRPAAFRMSDSKRPALVLCRVDRKRRFGHQQQSRGILFCEFFFEFFLFSHTERTRFGWCGLLVERHADQPKHVASI